MYTTKIGLDYILMTTSKKINLMTCKKIKTYIVDLPPFRNNYFIFQHDKKKLK